MSARQSASALADALANSEEEVEEIAEAAPVPESFKPVVVWLGGPSAPQRQIMVRPGHFVKPRFDGTYLLQTQEEVDLVKRVLGPQYWETDIFPPNEPMRDDSTGWTCRSTRAFQWHMNNGKMLNQN